MKSCCKGKFNAIIRTATNHFLHTKVEKQYKTKIRKRALSVFSSSLPGSFLVLTYQNTAGYLVNVSEKLALEANHEDNVANFYYYM